MKLTSDHIALNFFIIAYKNWKVKGITKQREFQTDCIILMDRLIYEYVMGKWKSSADAKIRNNIANLAENFKMVQESDWKKLLTDIFDNSKIEDKDITFELMKPLLFHFYCLHQLGGPNMLEGDSLDVDHIIPQVAFENSRIARKDVVKNNLLNLGVLLKRNNISKGKRVLNQIGEDEGWLKEQIRTYEFIKDEDFDKYSRPNAQNYEELFAARREIFEKAFFDA